MPFFKCANCALEQESVALDVSCRRCGSPVTLLDHGLPSSSRESLEGLPPGVWRYQAFLPVLPAQYLVTLWEGGTPLLPADRLGRELGLDHLLLKDESRNPTGSFIDRGSTVLVSMAKKNGVTTCTCTTTGNLGASLAAYCAKAAIIAKVKIQSSADREKLYQMIAFGAHVEASSARDSSEGSNGHSLSVTAGNPYLLEGEKTTGFEIIQDLGWTAPDVIIVPVGTGGHLSMIWRSVQQLRESGLIEKTECRLLGVQFRGSAAIVGRERRRGHPDQGGISFTELEESEPLFRSLATKAMKESHGLGLETTAAETVKSMGLLARTEGIFAEPASASVIASLGLAKSSGLIYRDDTVVCIITGAGLKDTRAISKIAKATRQVAAREDYGVAVTQVGETKLAVLRWLDVKPRFGYELWRGLSEGRRITTASVYQHLGELEGLGLIRRAGISTKKGRERVLYQLTRKGSDFLRMAGKVGRT